jgi:hypothetical protein
MQRKWYELERNGNSELKLKYQNKARDVGSEVEMHEDAFDVKEQRIRWNTRRSSYV